MRGTAQQPLIVFVHGLWMPGGESIWLRRQLSAELGWRCDLFAWRTVSEPIEAVSDRLRRQIDAHRPSALHLIGHSLGGLAVLRLFELERDLPPGRVVLLGAPMCGSKSARGLDRFRFGRWMLGQFVVDELIEAREHRWPHADRPLGVIAGTKPIGLGRLFAQFDEPNDGTVAVRETELEGAADRVVLPVSHLGMMLSRKVVEHTAHFLAQGRFRLG